MTFSVIKDKILFNVYIFSTYLNIKLEVSAGHITRHDILYHLDRHEDVTPVPRTCYVMNPPLLYLHIQVAEK